MANDKASFQKKCNITSSYTAPAAGVVYAFGRTWLDDNTPSRLWIQNDSVQIVACGNDHTILVTESGRVLSFGSNEWGQLGFLQKKTVSKPTTIKYLKGKRACCVACGAQHTILGFESNKIYAFGRNCKGQLGLGNDEEQLMPAEITALSDEGKLYVWGRNDEGQLGLPHIQETKLPQIIHFPTLIKFVDCGYYHSAIINDELQVFTFGEGNHGKLGFETATNVKLPTKIESLQNCVEVACGKNHTMVLASSGLVFSFGDGSYGQLGLGKATHQCSSPTLIPNLSNVKHISCGETHSGCITADYKLFLWGDNRCGKINNEDSVMNYYLPKYIERASSYNIIKLSLGGCHTAALMSSPLSQENLNFPILHSNEMNLQTNSTVEENNEFFLSTQNGKANNLPSMDYNFPPVITDIEPCISSSYNYIGTTSENGKYLFTFQEEILSNSESSPLRKACSSASNCKTWSSSIEKRDNSALISDDYDKSAHLTQPHAKNLTDNGGNTVLDRSVNDQNLNTVQLESFENAETIDVPHSPVDCTKHTLTAKRRIIKMLNNAQKNSFNSEDEALEKNTETLANEKYKVDFIFGLRKRFDKMIYGFSNEKSGSPSEMKDLCNETKQKKPQKSILKKTSTYKNDAAKRSGVQDYEYADQTDAPNKKSVVRFLRRNTFPDQVATVQHEVSEERKSRMCTII
ncbi:X-linked retinitis pigmentosa GTPase regulator [Trichinella pseudospiralis]|uniref:X-linked retinitis pigmentosa GTPase regulator n=1 Tax=Trichinella pseudospiralis TaxID=6337 RepID=A0A0V1KEE5_TRIPS|nr:X-linked retinitis pigmentosa GTPase regulator [Trichinella pseudospiralis]KRZ45189.1 X-linked retinitis pigmentosa GTPase regulator [Trichinella pseudospiralis]